VREQKETKVAGRVSECDIRASQRLHVGS